MLNERRGSAPDAPRLVAFARFVLASIDMAPSQR